jgi:hypothetical protein
MVRNMYIYEGLSESKFPHFISGDCIELVGSRCVLCSQAAFLVCCGTYDLHCAGGVGTVLCKIEDNGIVRAQEVWQTDMYCSHGQRRKCRLLCFMNGNVGPLVPTFIAV